MNVNSINLHLVNKFPKRYQLLFFFATLVPISPSFNAIYFSILIDFFDLILFSSLNENILIKHLTSVMRAPVRGSLANRGAEPSRQARGSVRFSKNEKKTAFVKKNKKNLY